eukprot:TRINITY_DN5846_c0_g1_i1.p1 TRINITY_DN5846_c0_g1~~TRINITY_DN5846_c0_g1_i1.p1  ORF type:complete len:275 (+),score=71.11 TRINITY_DN5846_c0_g1_i1:69-893(+)
MVRLPIASSRTRQLDPISPPVAPRGSTCEQVFSPSIGRHPPLSSEGAGAPQEPMSPTIPSEPSSPMSAASPRKKAQQARLESEVQNALLHDRSPNWSKFGAEAHGWRNQKSVRQKAAVNTLISALCPGGGKLDREQIKRLYKSVKQFDKDDSGDIDYEEFIQGLNLKDSNASRLMFQALDLDGSGTICYDELIEMIAKYAPVGKAALGTKREDRLRAFLKQADEELAEEKLNADDKLEKETEEEEEEEEEAEDEEDEKAKNEKGKKEKCKDKKR